MSDTVSVDQNLILLQASCYPEPQLFFLVERDDLELLRAAEGEWLRCLYVLPWEDYRDVGAEYYQALWNLNVEAARSRALRGQLDPNPESLEEAQSRLFKTRPTGGNDSAPLLLLESESVQLHPFVVRPEILAPGVVPLRLMGGRLPKCFFAMFKAFVGVHLMGKGASADEVKHHLSVSPPFVRACGFTLPDREKGYRHTDVPSLRKLEQFDKIMSDHGLWSKARVKTIRENLRTGVLDINGEALVHDTTHYVAYSEMTLYEVPEAEIDAETKPQRDAGVETGVELEFVKTQRPPSSTRGIGKKADRRSKAVRRGEKRKRRKEKKERLRENWLERRGKKSESLSSRGKRRSAKTRESSAPKKAKPTKKPVRKTQSKTVKNCQCPDRETCPHEWNEADTGAGSVIKGSGVHKKKYWAHKAGVFATSSGVPLDARAATDAANHDGTFLIPHLSYLFETYPELRGLFKEVLADAAYDDALMKEVIRDVHSLEVRTQTNPRRVKTILEGLPRGMRSLTPVGTLTCVGGHEMDYIGSRLGAEQFIYGPPGGREGQPICRSCPHNRTCCRRGTSGGRCVSIPFSRLNHLDPSDPPMARRFKAMMRKRTAVERAIKRIKLDFGDEKLSRRGNKAFQGHLDRSLIAFHLMLRLE